MLTLQMIACIGMIVGAFLLLGIRLNDFTGNIFRKLLNKPQGIREEILEETKQMKKSYLRREIEEVQKILLPQAGKIFSRCYVRSPCFCLRPERLRR